MAGSKSNYLENAILDHVLGGGDYTRPSVVYIALSSAVYNEAATGSAFTELAGAGYARVAVTNDPTNFPAASSGQKTNGSTLTFPTATGSWLEARSFYILDAMTGGNVLWGGDLTTFRTLLAGDTASFAVGSIVITED